MKPRQAIAESAGISGRYYKMIYTFLSTCSHGAPLPVSHNLALSEGNNDAQAMQWMFLSRQISITVWLGCFAMRDILKLYPDAEVKVHRKAQDLLSIWEDIVANWPGDKPDAAE